MRFTGSVTVGGVVFAFSNRSGVLSQEDSDQVRKAVSEGEEIVVADMASMGEDVDLQMGM